MCQFITIFPAMFQILFELVHSRESYHKNEKREILLRHTV